MKRKQAEAEIKFVKELMKIKHIFLLFLLASAAACSSVRVREQWQAKEAPAPFHKLLVLSITKEPGIRRIVEDSIAATFKQAGVDAIAGYTLEPGGDPASKESLRTQVKAAGADAVLVSRTVQLENRAEYVPAPHAYCGGFYSDYDCFWHDPYYSRGFVSYYQVGTLEADLYGATEDRLLWSAISTVEFEHFSREVVQDYAQALLEQLGKRGFLVIRKPAEN